VSRAPRRRRFVAPLGITLAIGVVVAAAGGCRNQTDEDTRIAASLLTGGDPSRGEGAIRRYGCGSCHTIPGVDGATSLVGPPLSGIAQRVYIAGVISNTPDHMVQWIMSPRSVDPRTAMPEMGVTLQDARDIAGYLYTLR
jgi:cytochrome c2